MYKTNVKAYILIFQSLETKSKKLAPWIELINEALSGKSKNKGDAKIGEILDIAMSLRSSGKSKSKKVLKIISLKKQLFVA